MARVGQQASERKDNVLYLKEVSVEQHKRRSTESIPRVFSNFDKRSSVDQNAGNFRRTRSFTLPRVLKKEKDTQSLIRIVFGTKGQQKQSKSKCDSIASILTKRDRDNGKSQSVNRAKNIRKQNTAKTKDSSVRQHHFVIPKICIQTPEEVNAESQFTRPVKIRLQDDLTQELLHDQPVDKECFDNRKQPASEHCEAPTSDNSENIKVARRKRSFSWSDVYSSGALKINTAEVLKGSSSWCAFLDSAAARETDLCSTDL